MRQHYIQGNDKKEPQCLKSYIFNTCQYGTFDLRIWISKGPWFSLGTKGYQQQKPDNHIIAKSANDNKCGLKNYVMMHIQNVLQKTLHVQWKIQ